MKNIRLISLLVVLMIFSTVNAQKYNIKIKVKGITDTVAYLGNYYGSKKYAIDTARIDNKGNLVFKGDKKLDGGMYIVLFPSRNMAFFEMLIGDDQEFSIETDTTDFFQKNLKTKGSLANSEFYKFQKQLNSIGKKLHNLQTELKAHGENKDSTDVLKKQLSDLGKEREKLLEETSNKTKSKTMKTIINLMREVQIPEFDIPKTVANKDSVKRVKSYEYYKAHYWDGVDLSDSTILRTPMFEPKLKRYMTQTILQQPDTVIKEGEALISKTGGKGQVFRYLVVYMLDYNNSSKLMGMDKVFVEIANKYYSTGKATWADSALLAKVSERATKMAPNLVGNQAPDLQRLESWDHKYYTLYDLKHDYIVIVFWEPHCGHCKKEIPKLHNVYTKLKAEGVDVEVMAIYTQVDREPWEKFIKEKEIDDWINVYDKYQFSNFRNLYDVYATPTIYVLDKDKKIIAKRLGSEQVEKFLLNLEKIKKGEKPLK